MSRSDFFSFLLNVLCFGKYYGESKSEVAQSCLTLCDPMDCSLPGSSVHGIFPGKSTGVLLPFPSPGDPSDPGIEPGSPVL